MINNNDIFDLNDENNLTRQELSKKIDNLNLDDGYRDRKQLEEDINILKKKNKGLRVSNFLLSIISIVFVVVFVLLLAIGYIGYKEYGGSIKTIINNYLDKKDSKNIATNSETKKSLDIDRIRNKLYSIDSMVEGLFYYEKDNAKIEDEIFKGYVKSLNDKYAEYMPPKAYENFSETESGEYYGIGASVSQNIQSMEAVVNEVFKNSPAEKAGVEVGDIIKTVDGVDVSQYELNSIVSMIKGEEGSKVKIGFYRKSIEDIIELECVRGKVEVQNVSEKVLDTIENNVGYMEIKEFTGKTLTQFKDTLEYLKQKNVNGLIIDLRNNPGGELSIVLNMLDYVLKDNLGKYTLNQNIFDEGKTLLVYMRDKKTIVDSYYCDDQHEVDMPIVILINGASASASELFSQALKDYGVATIVGSKSYGKGVMQNLIPLSDGSAIKFTVAGYFPPSGYNIDGNGVIPMYGIDYDGTKLNYDENGNFTFIDDKGSLIQIDKKGVAKVISTKSTANKKSTISQANKKDNLDITSNDFKYINDDWFIELDDKYDDKQLLQAIVLLK